MYRRIKEKAESNKNNFFVSTRGSKFLLCLLCRRTTFLRFLVHVHSEDMMMTCGGEEEGGLINLTIFAVNTCRLHFAHIAIMGGTDTCRVVVDMAPVAISARAAVAMPYCLGSYFASFFISLCPHVIVQKCQAFNI